MKGLKGVKQNFKRVGMSKGGIKYKGGDQTAHYGLIQVPCSAEVYLGFLQASVM